MEIKNEENLQLHINIKPQQTKGETMNLKLRLQNKATLVSIAGLIVSTIYQILGLLGIVPSISEDMITQGIGILLNIVFAVGIITDPTTPGVKDSKLAKNKTDIAEVIEYKKEN